MASKIIPYIPKHTVYVEPFCGGATMLFRKPWPKATNNDHYREVINDKDSLLINMYRMFQTRFEEIEHMLVNTLYSESEYKLAVDICKGNIKADDLTKAWAYYVNIQKSFANKFNGGWGRSVFGKNEAATWSSKICQLNEYRDRLKSVNITCQDALKVIKKWDSPQTFFYCDPPYPDTDQGHYSGYSQSDFDSLIDTLNGCEGSAIVSCYDQQIPAEWKRVEFSTFCSASAKGKTTNANRSRKATDKELGNRKRTEVILIKQASQPRPEIQKLYDSGKFDCFTGDTVTFHHQRK